MCGIQKTNKTNRFKLPEGRWVGNAWEEKETIPSLEPDLIPKAQGPERPLRESSFQSLPWLPKHHEQSTVFSEFLGILRLRILPPSLQKICPARSVAFLGRTNEKHFFCLFSRLHVCVWLPVDIGRGQLGCLYRAYSCPDKSLGTRPKGSVFCYKVLCYQKVFNGGISPEGRS